MDEEFEQLESGPGIDPSNLVMIVVGAHLRAEVADRPLAYQLCDDVGNWIVEHIDSLPDPPVPVVCSDIWYVNHTSLQSRPTISIGGPGVNALSAYYSDKIDAALVEENRIIIHLDPEFVELRVCVWGMDHELTVQALSLFRSQYLDGFMRAAATQVEPKQD